MKTLKNLDLIKSLGNGAKVVYQNYYIEDRMLNKYTKLYKSLCVNKSIKVIKW